MGMRHQHISFVKSVFRIVAGICLMRPHDFTSGLAGAMIAAGALLIIAELIGILEEIGHE